MRYANTEETRAIDEALARDISPYRWQTRGESLLSRAASGVSGFILGMCEDSAAPPPDVFVVFGGGDNGADAILAGLDLKERGWRVSFLAALPDGSEKGAVQRLRVRLGREHLDWQNNEDGWCSYPPAFVRPGSVVIDGVLGIGVSGAPRGEARAAIRWINGLKGRARIVSVDIPSGLDPEYGEPAGWDPDDAVRADFTICMGLPKIGMERPGALAFCGSVYVNDLEVPEDVAHHTDSDELVSARDIAALLPPRRWDAHKGDFGHVAIVGGSPGYSGAPFLAALGAARAGAGLVTLLSPADALRHAPAPLPETMVRSLPGAVATGAALEESGFDFAGKTVVAGPGFSRFDGAAESVLWLANESGAAALVLDADALNAFAGKAELLASIHIPLLLTPHPGEAARLLGTDAESIQSDRRLALMNLVSTTEAAVLLKGAGTLVSAPNEGFHLVACANPGMAKGGMGDFLAGVCGAYLARGLSPFDAARAAAWQHAAAADRAAWRLGRATMQPGDLRVAD
jgi:NAD(P)H-hydrate epimerase